MSKTQTGLGIAKNVHQVDTTAPVKKIMGIAIMPKPAPVKTMLGIVIPPKPAAPAFRMPLPEACEEE